MNTLHHVYRVSLCKRHTIHLSPSKQVE